MSPPLQRFDDWLWAIDVSPPGSKMTDKDYYYAPDDLRDVTNHSLRNLTAEMKVVDQALKQVLSSDRELASKCHIYKKFPSRRGTDIAWLLTPSQLTHNLIPPHSFPAPPPRTACSRWARWTPSCRPSPSPSPCTTPRRGG